MEESLLVITLGMIVYVLVGVLIALLIWVHGTGKFRDGRKIARYRLVPLYLQIPGRRLAASIVLTMLLGVSPWLMAEHFLSGTILFVSSLLVLAVIRGLVPVNERALSERS